MRHPLFDAVAGQMCLVFVHMLVNRSQVSSTLQNTYQDSVVDFEIVYPIITDISGNPVSHDHHHSYRHKRGYHVDNSIYLNISGYGQDFQIQLSENKHLLAPGFKIYHRKKSKETGVKDEIIAEEKHWSDSSCLYSGRVHSHRDGRAAISVCQGLNGIIRIAEEDYIIEPYKKQRLKSPSDQHNHLKPHKLYRRSAFHLKQTHYCGKPDRVKRSTSLVKSDQKYPTSKHVTDKPTHSWRKYQRAVTEHEERIVETLVVVDKTMYYKHGKDNVTTYTLTLFNMVAELFRDHSLGSNLNIVLVGLILLEGDEPGLSIGYHADNTLNSFCSWQSVLVGANGRQHDHAVLLTGLDLCSYKNAPCDTLGFAPIEGMCNRIRSCTINEDTGLSTAFTIAHEMGHNFGMFHDGEGNRCIQTTGTIMSSTLVGKDGQFHWSLCSKAYLMKFLNTPQAECLSDKPKHVAELQFPKKLPGELYDADVQCKWQFGHRAQLCTYDFGKDICKSIWCYRGRKRCETKFLPAAEGTSCGYGKWCRQGECVPFGQNGPSPIDGNWSEWSAWSECSRSCGGGVTLRERQCNKPLPQYGGKSCPGDEKVFKLCNVEKCKKGDDDFYNVQCSSYNRKPFRGWYLNWKPHKKLYNVQEPCKLYCLAETNSYVFTIKHTATDGMKCMGDKNMCVEGVCKPIGCDWVVGSSALDDVCGVCRGDNSSCQIIQGEYREQPKLNTYFPVAILPKTARSIKITEKALSSNYIAIRDIFGNYFLNGKHRVGWPGEYLLGGVKFIYKRPYNEPETLESKGPLKEDLVLEILVQDKNPGIHYQYALPHQTVQEQKLAPRNNFTWSINVSPCSEPCAGGKKNVTAVCQRNLYEQVNDSYCKEKTKPEIGIFPCNEQPCPARWIPEDWQQCSKTCGRGKQKRKIYCRQRVSISVEKRVKKRQCKSLPKPARSRRCNIQDCPPTWRVGKWHKCSVSCGVGTQARKVFCRSKSGKKSKVMPDKMCAGPKPQIVKPCRRSFCPQKNNYEWQLSPWGPCSKTCGLGKRHRYVTCKRLNYRGKIIATRDKYCAHKPRPNVTMEETCKVMLCPTQIITAKPKWKAFQWSQCSASCGEGQRSRDIKCIDLRGQQTSGCDLKNRPATSQICNSGACPLHDYDVGCTDKYTWCHLVPEHNVCNHEFYGTHCCRSCIKHR